MKYRVALILTLAGFSAFPSLAEPQGAVWVEIRVLLAWSVVPEPPAQRRHPVAGRYASGIRRRGSSGSRVHWPASGVRALLSPSVLLCFGR